MDSRTGFERFLGVDEHYDFSRYIALPGFIDIHVHFRGLELSYKEDEKTGSMAAAKGGFTLVVDMPNTRPRIDNVEALRAKLRSFEENSYVDYGVWIATPRSIKDLREMISEPRVFGLKLYPEDYDLFEKISSEIIRYVKRIIIHAEDPSSISEQCDKGYRWRCRSIDSEVRALERLSRVLSREVATHITHVTNPLTSHTAKHLGYSTDTCPHYIYLDSSHEERLGCVAKVNPPLRPGLVRELLLREAVSRESSIDMFSTDHAPHTIDEKSRDFSECPSGIASIEFTGSLLLNLVSKGLMDLGTLIEKISIRPAEFLGLEEYGCVDKGCVASYTIADLDKEFIIRSSDMVSKAGNTPYDGTRVKGYIHATIVRGSLVYREGEFFERPF